MSRRPFLLFGQPRAGSVLLGSLMASHPDVRIARDGIAVTARRPHLGLAHARHGHRGHHVGLHLDPARLAGQHVASWLHVAAHRGWLVVHVQRTDALRHELAHLPRPVFDVDPLVLRDAMQARRARNLQERADLLGVEHLSVSYEDDLDSPLAWQPTADRLLRAIGLAPVPVSTRLPHQPDRALEDLLGNAAEVRAVLG